MWQIFGSFAHKKIKLSFLSEKKFYQVCYFHSQNQIALKTTVEL